MRNIPPERRLGMVNRPGSRRGDPGQLNAVKHIVPGSETRLESVLLGKRETAQDKGCLVRSDYGSLACDEFAVQTFAVHRPLLETMHKE